MLFSKNVMVGAALVISSYIVPLDMYSWGSYRVFAVYAILCSIFCVESCHLMCSLYHVCVYLLCLMYLLCVLHSCGCQFYTLINFLCNNKVYFYRLSCLQRADWVSFSTLDSDPVPPEHRDTGAKTGHASRRLVLFL